MQTMRMNKNRMQLGYLSYSASATRMMFISDRNRVTSLLKNSIRCISDNLSVYINNEELYEILNSLPGHLKDQLLTKYIRKQYCEVTKSFDYKQVFGAFLHPGTDSLNFISLQIDDELLEMLQTCTNLKQLNLMDQPGITKEAMQNLFVYTKRLYTIQIINSTVFDDDVLRCLAENCPHLTEMSAKGCNNITDKGLKILGTMKNLAALTITENVQISDEGIFYLLENNKGEMIRELKIVGCPKITDISLKKIADCCLNLEIFICYKCADMEDDSITAFQKFSQCKKLKHLTWTIR